VDKNFGLSTALEKSRCLMLDTLAEPTLLVARCLIGGEWAGADDDAILDPASGDCVAQVPHLGAGETAQAIDAAAAAFASWSQRPAAQRSTVLRRWAALLVQHADDLARILTAEQGKPLAEARGEIVSAAGYIDFFADEARRVPGEMTASHRSDCRIVVRHQPIGVVGAITPWNFPAGMIARKLAPALAVGCTVVLKPAPETPLTALAMAGLGVRAGLPAGTLNVVTGDAAAIGKALFDDARVRFVSFTGSTEVGKLLMRLAADGVKKLGLELGGHAPFIVLDDADLDAAVEGAMAAKFRNMGQTCVAANRFWVHADVHDAFVEALLAEVVKLRVGRGSDPGVTQGPLINAEAVAKVEAHVADARARGATLLCGGARHALGRSYYEPTVLTGVSDDMLVAQEETFGPVAAISRFSSDRDLLERVNASKYGLAAYLYGRDLGRVLRLAERLEYGMVGINAVALGTELAPIGGMKQSGLGREGSRHGLLEYCEMQYLLLGGL
jgi:succinate-semialdehyde dehydrogenase / glutarate-semialdehyde dehydrogenase